METETETERDTIMLNESTSNVFGHRPQVFTSCAAPFKGKRYTIVIVSPWLDSSY